MPKMTLRDGVWPFHARGIEGHLLATDEGVWACYLLASTSRRDGSEDEQDKDHSERMHRLHELVGYRVHERVSLKPFSAKIWREALRVSHPNPLPDVPGGMPLEEHLAEWEAHIEGQAFTDGLAYFCVRVSDKPVAKVGLLLSGGDCPEATRKIRDRVHHVDEVMGRPMMGGRRMTPWGVAYMLHTSTGLGLKAPTPATLKAVGHRWTEADLASIWGAVRVTHPDGNDAREQAPFSTVLRLSAARESGDHHSFVSILTAGSLDGRDATAPGLWPWMADAVRHNGKQIHLEWSATYDVKAGEAVAGKARWRRNVAEDILHGFELIGQRPPERLRAVLADAIRVESEVTDGKPVDAARAVGVWRAAVVADSEAEVLDQRAAVIAHFQSPQRHGISLHALFGQAEQWGEFATGEPRTIEGFDQTMGMGFLATAWPNLNVTAGTATGPFRGATSKGPRRAYRNDPHWGPEHRCSGSRTNFGGLGQGKSSEMAGTFIWEMTLGARALLVDPTQSFAKLATIRELGPYLAVIDVMKGPAGEFSPYLWVPDPDPDEYPTVEALEVATANAEAERRSRAIDTFSDLIHSTYAGENTGSAFRLMSMAVGRASAGRDTNPWEVCDFLTASGAPGAEIADVLASAARTEIGMRVFPKERGAFTPRDIGARGTIFVAPGLKAPLIPDQTLWTREERLAALVLRNVAARAMWEMYRDLDRKMIGLDEFIVAAGGFSSIKPMVLRGVTDSRRRNCLFNLSAQNPAHVTSIDPRLPSLIGSARVFRLDLASARDALAYLRLPEGRGHEQEITRLGLGEAKVRDWDAPVVDVAFDQGPIASHREALVTNPPKPPQMDGLDEYDLAEAS